MRTPAYLAGVALCVWVGLHSTARGQGVPPVPAVPAAPAAAAAATTAAPAAGPNLWTFFCPPPGWHEKCKEKYCNSFLGQFVGASLRPLRMFTGGALKPCCPTDQMAKPGDLAKAADSPAGAAARIKQDEADAKARRADVRFLGTVDCNRYPEAEQALIKALRTDRNECVRFEAALSLGNGCCCNKNTVQALLLTANGSDKDGNPVETSPRVKQAAAYALAVCQGRQIDATPEPPEKAVPLPEPKKLPDLTPAAFRPIVSASNESLPRPDMMSGTVPSGQRGLLQIFLRRTTPSNMAEREKQ